ncbi:hypothetical protein [Sphingomonas sp. Ag1]|uniref:hypothetical protein n=1 Tax=Sphingomonas sp. Ag1 TaxID=1642949 RepID=UPI0006222972|nr:hypothetical protein [Sphingomonas sp. Ag1]KKI21968.1 hypothetical protein XM50_01360 [Sphingomonas sp. Ag1]
MTDYNPNDPLLADYQRRFFEAYDRIVDAIEKKQKARLEDFKLMKELHFIMTEYRRDPFKPILLTKLSYDPARYTELEHVLAYVRDQQKTLDWWRNWKPGALFV